MKKVFHYLTDVNLKGLTAVLFTMEEGDKHWTKIHVSISKRLRWRIQNQQKIATDPRWSNFRLKQGDTYEGTIFETTDTDTRYFTSPFKLTEFRPINGSDIPVNFHLTTVDHAIVPVWKKYQNKYGKFRDISLKPANWVRYAIQDVEKKLNQTNVSFVLPYIQLVPVEQK